MKIIKIICVLCTLLSINLNVIFADDGWTVVSDYDGFANACNTDDAKIKLDGNIDIESSIYFSKKITIDLNGYNITQNNPFKDQSINLLDNSDLTIVDTSSSDSGKISTEIRINSSSAKLTLETGELETVIDDSCRGNLIINGGIITINRLIGLRIHANGGTIVINDTENIDSDNDTVIITDEGKIGSTINGTIYGGTLYGTQNGNYTISGNKVTYKNDNDTYAIQVIQTGKKVTTPIAPSKDNYSFVGWFTDENCTTEYDFNTRVSSDISLYAGYTPATITFDTKGGTTVNPIKQEYGSTVTVETPTKKGYIFDGWDTVIPSTMPAHDMSINAKWTECTNHDLVEIVNDETLKSEATCNSKAIYYKSCSKCGYISDEIFEYGEVDLTKHDYSADWTIDKEPTCTTNGSKSHHCTRCNDKTDITPIEKKGHSLTKTERKEPTTEEVGNIEYYYCGTCKKYFSDYEGTNEITKESTVLNKLTKSSKTTTSSYDDGGPFMTDSCGNVYDRWNNKIYSVTSCNVGGYNLVRTDVKD